MNSGNEPTLTTGSYSDDFVRAIDVHTLLPQQEPFVMIGRLDHFDMIIVKTSTHVSTDNIFVEDGLMSASGIVENIAQTCAARIGFINKYILKKGISIGYIGAVRNFSITRLPRVGELLNTEVVIKEEIFGMVLASATVAVNDEIIAHTEIKIAIKE